MICVNALECSSFHGIENRCIIDRFESSRCLTEGRGLISTTVEQRKAPAASGGRGKVRSFQAIPIGWRCSHRISSSDQPALVADVRHQVDYVRSVLAGMRDVSPQ